MDSFLEGLFILNSVSVKPPIAARRSGDSSSSSRGEVSISQLGTGSFNGGW